MPASRSAEIAKQGLAWLGGADCPKLSRDLCRDLPLLLRRHGARSVMAYLAAAHQQLFTQLVYAVPSLSPDDGRADRVTAINWLQALLDRENGDLPGHSFAFAALVEAAEALRIAVLAAEANGIQVNTTATPRPDDTINGINASRWLPKDNSQCNVLWRLRYELDTKYFKAEGRSDWFERLTQESEATKAQVDLAGRYVQDLHSCGFIDVRGSPFPAAGKLFLSASDASLWDSWMSIDPMSSLPLIHAEGIKGAIRATAEAVAKTAPDSIGQAWIDTVFGSDDAAQPSCIEWADAIWLGKVGEGYLAADTRTPHEATYHQRADGTGDDGYAEPTPTASLAARGKFAFLFRLTPFAQQTFDRGDQALLVDSCHKVAQWALSYRGIGARVNNGEIGRFRVG